MVFPRAKVHKNSSAIELKKWKRMVLGKAKFCICILLAATVLRLQNHKCESPVSNTVFKIQSFYSDSELYLCRSFFREQVHGTITYTQFRIPLLLAALLYFWCKLHFLYRHQICRHGKNQFQLFYAYVLQNSKVWYIQDRKKPARDLISFLCKSKQEDVSVPFAESLFPFSSQSENLLQ